MQRTHNYPFEDLGAPCLAAAKVIRDDGFQPETVQAAADMVQTSLAAIEGELVSCFRNDPEDPDSWDMHDRLLNTADELLTEVQGEEWSNFASVADAYEAVGKLLEAAGRL